MQKAHHHIGHLHAGVVDVVLHIDLLPGSAQQADECVAQNGVAQMSDVRGLVGIDAGVLDQRMTLDAQVLHRDMATGGAGNRVCGCRAVQPRIDVPGTGDLKSRKAFQPTQRRHNLLRNDLRRLAQLARQLKGNGRRQLAKLQIRRSLQRNGLELNVVSCRATPREDALPSLFCNSRNTSKCLKILDFQG